MGRRTSQLVVRVGSSPGLQGGSAQARQLRDGKAAVSLTLFDTAAGGRRRHALIACRRFSPSRRFTPSAALVAPTHSHPQPHRLPLTRRGALPSVSLWALRTPMLDVS